jgi:hypothetical protein
MSAAAQEMQAGERKCPFCGKPVRSELTQCPFCREALPQVGRISRGGAAEGRRKIRRGLLFMLLALIIYYYLGGYSGWQVPIPVPPLVNHYLTPLLFLGGSGMTLYGLFLMIRS